MPDETKIPSRQNWFIRDGTVKKELQLSSLVEMYITYMFDRTLMMFDYKGLPDGITNKDMEKFTQMEGKSFFLKHNGRFYILYGSFYDFITWNKEPSKALIVNPALPDLKQFYTIDVDCVVVPNDSNYYGLYPMMESNAVQMAQADISLAFAGFNTRFKSMFTADDDNTKDSINKLIEDIWNGVKPSAVLTDDLYKNSVNGISYNQGQTNDIVDLIELKQYIKANWYIDLGINANYNMKRESLNESEMQVNDDALMPLIDNMLYVRKKAIEKINQIFDLNISVEFSSAWKKIKKEIENSMKMEEAEIQTAEEPTNENEGGEADGLS